MCLDKVRSFVYGIRRGKSTRHSMVINCESPNHCQKAIKASWNGKLTNKGEFTTLGGKRAFEM